MAISYESSHWKTSAGRVLHNYVIVNKYIGWLFLLILLYVCVGFTKIVMVPSYMANKRSFFGTSLFLFIISPVRA